MPAADELPLTDIKAIRQIYKGKTLQLKGTLKLLESVHDQTRTHSTLTSGQQDAVYDPPPPPGEETIKNPAIKNDISKLPNPPNH